MSTESGTSVKSENDYVDFEKRMSELGLPIIDAEVNGQDD